MAIFEKSIPDAEWVELVSPVFASAKAIGDEMSRALEEQDGGQEIEVISKVITVFPNLIEAVRRAPKPDSSVAREVRKNLELALRDYVDGAKQGQMLFRDWQKGLGARAELSGFAGRAAKGRVVFQLGMYKGILEKAQNRLAAVERYLA